MLSICAGSVAGVCIELDRAVAGMATPLATPIPLASRMKRCGQITLWSAELGALNIGGEGVIRVDGKSYAMGNLDCLYIGRGEKEILFKNADANTPAIFYLLSYPALQLSDHDVVHKDQVSPVELGSVETCNRRTVCKYISV